MAARFQELTTYEEVKRCQEAGMLLYYRYMHSKHYHRVTWTVSPLDMEREPVRSHVWQYGYLAEDDD